MIFSAQRSESEIDSSVTAPTRFYIPSLDGIRTIAFAIVFLSHAGNDSHGIFGVTLFFFLSGYLITTLLRKENDRHCSISLRAFYARRTLRIMPPFYLTMLVILLLVWSQWLPTRWIPGPFVATCLFLNNYWKIYRGMENPGLGPMWSLAVEEHFYLLFPLLFVWMNRVRLAYRTQAFCLGGLAVAALLWRVYLMTHNATLVHLTIGSDTRMDSILFGCIMALVFNPMFPQDKLPSTLWTVLAAVILLASFLVHNTFYRLTLHFTLQGVVLVPLFVAIICHANTWFRWLNQRWMRYLGTLTYSLYLVHVSLLQVAFHYVHSRALAGFLALFASLAFAVLINLLVERPLIKWRQRLTVDAHATNM